MRHDVIGGLSASVVFLMIGRGARPRGFLPAAAWLLFAVTTTLSASSSRAQDIVVGSFVDEFTKQLTKFTPPDSYSGSATIRIPSSLSSGTPQGRGADPVSFEHVIGRAYNLIDAGASPTVPPLQGEVGPFFGIHINERLGATRFYGAGVNGSNSVVATIEGGRAWNGHETLSHSIDIPGTLQPSQIDRHATWTSALLGGRPGGSAPGTYQTGIVPGAELHSGGFGTLWGGTRYSFAYSFFANVLFSQYEQAMLSGLEGPHGLQTADAINSSYAIVGEPVSSTVELMLDALADTNPNSTMVFAAGNSGLGINTLSAPATGYNGITVASLSSQSNFMSPATLSSGGNIDYRDPVNGTARGVRRGVDIAAPGEDLASAYYGGLTGGNSTILNGPPSGPLGGADFYTLELNGTSYASPLVTGGVALIHDAADVFLPTVSAAHDSRVVKAVIMNAADKTLGWDNGQVPHPNGNGGVDTDFGLDPRVGTGRMNLDTAFDQFLSGTTDVPGMDLGNQGQVQEIGWDLGLVDEGTPTDYFITKPLEGGSTLTTTLTWFRDRGIVETPDGFLAFTDESYADLDLEIWSVTNNAPDLLISESDSGFNNTEHLAFEVPHTGRYMIRVNYFEEIFDSTGGLSPNEVVFGLAWSGTAIPTPEPSTVVIVCVAGASLALWRRKRPARKE